MWTKSGSGSCVDVTIKSGDTYDPNSIVMCSSECSGSDSLVSKYTVKSSTAQCAEVLTKGGLAGIIIGSLVLLAAMVFLCWKKKRCCFKQQFQPQRGDLTVRVAPQPQPVAMAVKPQPAVMIAAPGSGWQAQVDASTGRTYYYNKVTGESSWSPPAAPVQPPPGVMQPAPESEWQTQVDRASGKTYYINRVTGESSWSPPGSPPVQPRY